MSKNGGNANNASNDKDPMDQDQSKLEHPKAAVNRLTKEIIHECKLISTGQKESCYTLVEKTKQLIDFESRA